MVDISRNGLKKTTITWWRYGKEHERSDPNPPYIRNNGPAMAEEALNIRLARYRAEQTGKSQNDAQGFSRDDYNLSQY